MDEKTLMKELKDMEYRANGTLEKLRKKGKIDNKKYTFGIGTGTQTPGITVSRQGYMDLCVKTISMCSSISVMLHYCKKSEANISKNYVPRAKFNGLKVRIKNILKHLDKI